jgi:hypothetical protein
MSEVNLGTIHNPFAEVNEKVAKAGEFLNLKPGVISALSSCEREVVISIPLRKANDIEVLTAAYIKPVVSVIIQQKSIFSPSFRHGARATAFSPHH